MNSNRKFVKKYITYCIFFAATFCLSYYIDSLGDDFVFADGINKYGSFIGWLKFFSQNWGGRVIPQGILVLILQTPDILFIVINAFMWIVLLLYIVRIYSSRIPIKREYLMGIFLVSIFILIPSYVLKFAVFWKCANVLYLWGTAFSFIALYPIICEINNISYSKSDIVYAFLAGVYASSFEQIAAFLCVASIILVFYLYIKKTILKKYIVLLEIWVWILTIFFTNIKGNHVRYEVEVLDHFNNFGMFSIFDKMLIGTHYAIEGIESCMPTALLILAATALFSCVKSKENDNIMKFFTIGCFWFFLMNFIHRTGVLYNSQKYFIGRLFVVLSADNKNFDFSVFSLGSTVLNVFMITFLGVNISMAFGDKFNIVTFLTYFGGLATMFMMGFSPSIYASGQRPMFIGCLFLLCCELSAINDFLGGREKNIGI